MTQSGQGEEPSARPAREGIVLPSDGGEPLLPGMTAPAPAPAAPAGGQAWNGSWGPEQQAPRPGQGWPPATAQQWGTPDARPPAAANPGPMPPEGAPAQSYGGPQPSYGPGDQQPHHGGQPAYGAPDPYRQNPQHPQNPQQYAAPTGPLPPAYPAASAPLPPTADGATQYIPPVQGGPEGATQYIPPVQAGPEGATQYIPPVQADSADGATQYIPPVPAGALPPESAGEETRYLGRTPQQAAPAHPDAEATQYIPPYAAQADGADRQPPAEFDSLFRGGPAGGEGPAGSTQQLPRVPDAHPGPAQSSYGERHSYDDHRSYDAHDGGGRRSGRSRVPLIAAIGIGIVVIGVGAGALLGGGGDKDSGGDDKTVAAASPTTQDSASPSADPARQQAVALDKLLADSGSSRASVIQAVTDVRRCANLDQAASNLRGAAKQRGQLVTRLGKLSVDRLPNSGDLTTALTKAWQASAAADNHYAAWADQTKGRKGCHKGQARGTGQTQAGDRESGTASAQKVKAAALWNSIATKYGLTQRQPTQL
ncbi:hypothetical protein GCM10010503_49770 [Streptomyces lucensis JCM 4490]|uniref:Uncharacterized protein n=1 Tax=Streptomyces lucensis JCM 4490 TaxID=1306176 RepID=A0A918JAH4_9ACTN|nr:hypothetical protein [Streptomyces lucensis]GGW66563.1 hypothetical protein GCM10010503_49770 [Streptomyces lucensis JCM 4490]